MAAYRRVYDSRHLQADCQEPGSAPELCARQSSMGYLYLFKELHQVVYIRQYFYVVADERRANNYSLRHTYLLRYFLLSCQGIVAVPGGAGGFLLGGFIIKRMSLTIVQQLRGMFVMGIVGVCAMLMFCVQCDYAPLAETTVHQHPEHANRLVLDDNS